MNKENDAEKSALNWDLNHALFKWQDLPNDRASMEKMQEMLNRATKDFPIVVTVRKDTLRNLNLKDSFITPGVADAYGQENGSLIEFDTSTVLMKVSEMDHKGYLFLEKDVQRLAYFKPGLIIDIKIK